MRFSTLLAALALGAASTTAHPGGHGALEELAERRHYMRSVARSSLAHCADKLRARNLEKGPAQRRAARVAEARVRRGIVQRRDAASVLATSHNKTGACYSPSTDPATLFAGFHSCLLTPEVTQGPYYVAGEYVREDVRETQAGVELLLDYQVVDVNTCDPVPGVYVEIWHCNATGVYSGVVASGNGDSSDTSNLDATFLRGIQASDDDGVAAFTSIFPGHYTGRATHIHVMVHTGNSTTVLANSTLGTAATYASHVGQAFFDQTLITAVEQLQPYAGNTQTLTTNADDSIFNEEAATDDVDPVMEYTLLGSSLADGLFAWLAFGINTTLSNDVTPAAYLYADGGVENANSGVGGGAGGGGGGGAGGPNGTFNGTAPSGVPTGAAPTSL